MGAYTPLPWAPADLVERGAARRAAAHRRRDGAPRHAVRRAALRRARAHQPRAPGSSSSTPASATPRPSRCWRCSTRRSARCSTPPRPAPSAGSTRRRGRPGAAVAVVMASAGYPESSSSGDVITGVDAADSLPDVHVVHAGTADHATATWSPPAAGCSPWSGSAPTSPRRATRRTPASSAHRVRRAPSTAPTSPLGSEPTGGRPRVLGMASQERWTAAAAEVLGTPVTAAVPLVAATPGRRRADAAGLRGVRRRRRPVRVRHRPGPAAAGVLPGRAGDVGPDPARAGAGLRRPDRPRDPDDRQQPLDPAPDRPGARAARPRDRATDRAACSATPSSSAASSTAPRRRSAGGSRRCWVRGRGSRCPARRSPACGRARG